MRTRAAPRAADPSYNVSLRHGLSRLHRSLPKMKIPGDDTLSVIDQHRVARQDKWLCGEDLSRIRSLNRGARQEREIESAVIAVETIAALAVAQSLDIVAPLSKIAPRTVRGRR